MRSLGLVPKLVAACGAAFALVLSLSLPWYGTVPGAVPAGEDELFAAPNWDAVAAALPRLLAENAGLTAWDLGGQWAMGLAGLGVLAGVAILLCLVPAAEDAGRGLLQVLGLAAAGVVLFRLLVRPEGLEPRFGLFASMAAASALVLASQSVATARSVRRTEPVRRYAGSAAPAPYDTGTSVSPPAFTSPHQF